MKVRRVKDNRVLKLYRLLPYDELETTLRADGQAFIESSGEEPIKYGTVWKAARRLSETLGTRIRVDRSQLQLRGGASVVGYLLSSEAPRSQNRKGNVS